MFTLIQTSLHRGILRAKALRRFSQSAILFFLLLVFPAVAPAQSSSPFDTGFTALQNLFTGTVAKVASLIAIVIGEYQFAHGKPGSKKITTVAGNGTGGYTGDGGSATSAEPNFPGGVALDTNGNLYIGDAQNNRIREVAIPSGTITTVAGNGVAGYSGDGNSAIDAELDFPSRPFIDSAGNIYIADYQNNRLRKIIAATGLISTIAGTGSAGYSGDGGVATSAELNGPLNVTVDSAGVVYIADTNNERIRAVNTTANPITVLGITIQLGQIQTGVEHKWQEHRKCISDGRQ